MFYRKTKVRYRGTILLPTIRPLFPCSSGCSFVFIMLVVLTCGDVESNPLPGRRCFCYNFSLCHCNFNSMTAHNSEKINLIETCNTINKG